MNAHANPSVTVEKLRPSAKRLLLDLVREAGHDVSDWAASSKNGALGASKNPKYCYEWAFVEPSRGIILNLWHEALEVGSGGEIVHRSNFRKDAERLAVHTPGSPRARRARGIDQALQTAARDKLTIRVILNAGRRRNLDDPGSPASSVDRRALDSEPWTLTSYDWATGEHLLVRGAAAPAMIDQFSVEVSLGGAAQRTERSSFVYSRDAKVRRSVLARSAGSCEHCGDSGFRCPDGSIYLETHHIVPLHEKGPDVVANVIALCPSHHREAHFGKRAPELRLLFLDVIRRLSPG